MGRAEEARPGWGQMLSRESKVAVHNSLEFREAAGSEQESRGRLDFSEVGHQGPSLITALSSLPLSLPLIFSSSSLPYPGLCTL